MKNWKDSIIGLGQVKENTRTVFTFEKLSAEPIVKKITPSCESCTKIIKWDQNILTIEYKSSSVPSHLGNEYESQKRLEIEYDTGEKETLYFGATVVKRRSKHYL